jgi:hypothetical protein
MSNLNRFGQTTTNGDLTNAVFNSSIMTSAGSTSPSFYMSNSTNANSESFFNFNQPSQQQQFQHFSDRDEDSTSSNLSEMMSLHLNEYYKLATQHKLAASSPNETSAEYSPSKSSSNEFSSPESIYPNSKSSSGMKQQQQHDDSLMMDEMMMMEESGCSSSSKQHITKLFVGNLPTSTTLPELLDVFKKYGPVNEKLSVVKDQNYAFIHFFNRKDAELALSEVNDSLFKDRYIRVQFSTSQGFTTKTKGYYNFFFLD